VSSVGDVRGTLGVNWTTVDAGDTDNSAARAFAGVEVSLLNKLTLAAEYQTKDGDVGDEKPLTSLVARYRANPMLTVQAGVTNAGLGGFAGSEDHHLFVGASFGFGAQ